MQRVKYPYPDWPTGDAPSLPGDALFGDDPWTTGAAFLWGSAPQEQSGCGCGGEGGGCGDVAGSCGCEAWEGSGGEPECDSEATDLGDRARDARPGRSVCGCKSGECGRPAMTGRAREVSARALPSRASFDSDPDIPIFDDVFGEGGSAIEALKVRGLPYPTPRRVVAASEHSVLSDPHAPALSSAELAGVGQQWDDPPPPPPPELDIDLGIIFTMPCFQCWGGMSKVLNKNLVKCWTQHDQNIANGMSQQEAEALVVECAVAKFNYYQLSLELCRPQCNGELPYVGVRIWHPQACTKCHKWTEQTGAAILANCDQSLPGCKIAYDTIMAQREEICDIVCGARTCLDWYEYCKDLCGPPNNPSCCATWCSNNQDRCRHDNSGCTAWSCGSDKPKCWDDWGAKPGT
jgi:hypothetical protein